VRPSYSALSGSPAIRSGPKSGWHEVGGRRIYFASGWEKKYACYLEWLRHTGRITEWVYEPPAFWFDKPKKIGNKRLSGVRRGVTSNTLDFMTTELNGDAIYHEVKGYMDNKSKTRLARTKLYYPDVRVIVIDKVLMSEISKKLGRLIPGWND
jgi:hypothetical protein